MKRTRYLAALGVLVGMALTACGSDNSSPPVSQTPTPQALDTTEVLALARQSSETSVPLAVDNGALTFTDTSDTSEPISINLM